MLADRELLGLPRFHDFDSLFQEFAARYAPALGWYTLKAQAIQESLLDPEAVSPAGAVGLMQFMPKTWEWVGGLLWGRPKDPRDPVASIEAGTAYMAWLLGLYVPGMGAYRGFSRVKPLDPERWSFALAAYNAGQGHVQRARLAAKTQNVDPDRWDRVAAFLPGVTGERNALETTTYVTNVRGYRAALIHAGRR